MGRGDDEAQLQCSGEGRKKGGKEGDKSILRAFFLSQSSLLLFFLCFEKICFQSRLALYLVYLEQLAFYQVTYVSQRAYCRIHNSTQDESRVGVAGIFLTYSLNYLHNRTIKSQEGNCTLTHKPFGLWMGYWGTGG